MHSCTACKKAPEDEGICSPETYRQLSDHKERSVSLGISSLKTENPLTGE